MQCFYHPEKGAVGLCTNCGKAACLDCIEDMGGSLLCIGCQEIARSEQVAAEQEEQAERDRVVARAALKLRIGRYVFWGVAIFGAVMGIAQLIGAVTGSLQDPRLSSPSGIISFVIALPFGVLIAAYVIWAFYWGEIAAWRFWMNLFRRTGWSVHASLVGWMTLLLLFVTCPYMLGIFYGVFGGGIVEYTRTKRLAGNAGGAALPLRRIAQRAWPVVVALAILIVGSIVAVSREAQRRQESLVQAIESTTPAPQPVPSSSGAAAVPQVAAPIAKPGSTFTFLGEFSNEDERNARFDPQAEPRPPYRVELWMDEATGIVGHVFYPVLEADSPVARVQDATFDEASGAITFQARIWSGNTFPENEPQYQIHTFTGILKDGALEGAFSRQDEDRRFDAVQEDVTLKQVASREQWESITTRVQWEAEYSSLVMSRWE